MNRLLLSVVSAILAGVVTTPALAANSTDAATRTQIEHKRDQVSGADRLKTKTQGPSTLLDAPVVTDDAPSQTAKP